MLNVYIAGISSFRLQSLEVYEQDYKFLVLTLEYSRYGWVLARKGKHGAFKIVLMTNSLNLLNREMIPS